MEYEREKERKFPLCAMEFHIAFAAIQSLVLFGELFITFPFSPASSFPSLL